MRAQARAIATSADAVLDALRVLMGDPAVKPALAVAGNAAAARALRNAVGTAGYIHAWANGEAVDRGIGAAKSALLAAGVVGEWVGALSSLTDMDTAEFGTRGVDLAHQLGSQIVNMTRVDMYSELQVRARRCAFAYAVTSERGRAAVRGPRRAAAGCHGGV